MTNNSNSEVQIYVDNNSNMNYVSFIKNKLLIYFCRTPSLSCPSSPSIRTQNNVLDNSNLGLQKYVANNLIAHFMLVIFKKFPTVF